MRRAVLFSLIGLLFAGALASSEAAAQPGPSSPDGPGGPGGPHPMCVPIAGEGRKAERPCPIPPPPRAGMAPLEEGSRCMCGTLEGQVRNGPPRN